MRLLSKIRISPLILLIFSIGIFFNQVEKLLILYLICFIHECGHVLGARILRCRIKKFTFSFFGFSAEIENIDYLSFYQQILIYLAGPLTFFITLLILILLKNYNLINQYQFNQFNNDNLTIALFNLLPLYPLDGGRIIYCIYKKISPIKKAIIYRSFWSFISLLPVIFLLIRNQQYLLLIFIMLIVVTNIFNLKKEYLMYLKQRLFIDFNFPKKISFQDEIYHFYSNDYLINGKLKNEKEVIPYLIIKK